MAEPEGIMRCGFGPMDRQAYSVMVALDRPDLKEDSGHGAVVAKRDDGHLWGRLSAQWLAGADRRPAVKDVDWNMSREHRGAGNDRSANVTVSTLCSNSASAFATFLGRN